MALPPQQQSISQALPARIDATALSTPPETSRPPTPDATPEYYLARGFGGHDGGARMLQRGRGVRRAQSVSSAASRPRRRRIYSSRGQPSNTTATAKRATRHRNASRSASALHTHARTHTYTHKHTHAMTRRPSVASAPKTELKAFARAENSHGQYGAAVEGGRVRARPSSLFRERRDDGLVAEQSLLSTDGVELLRFSVGRRRVSPFCQAVARDALLTRVLRQSIMCQPRHAPCQRDASTRRFLFPVSFAPNMGPRT